MNSMYKFKNMLIDCSANKFLAEACIKHAHDIGYDLADMTNITHGCYLGLFDDGRARLAMRRLSPGGEEIISKCEFAEAIEFLRMKREDVKDGEFLQIITEHDYGKTAIISMNTDYADQSDMDCLLSCGFIPLRFLVNGAGFSKWLCAKVDKSIFRE